MEEVITRRTAAPVTAIEEIFSNEEIVPLEEKVPAGFNFSKLQAALCILASALVSIAVIAWLIAG
jgi:hypothetical protein